MKYLKLFEAFIEEDEEILDVDVISDLDSLEDEDEIIEIENWNVY